VCILAVLLRKFVNSCTMNKTSILLSFLLLAVLPVFAQESEIHTLEQNGKFYKAVEFEVKPNTFYTSIDPQFKASSLTFETRLSNTLHRAYVLLGGTQRFNLKKDDHNTDALQENAARNSNQSSELYLSDDEFSFFSFFSGDISGTVRVNLMYAPPLKIDKNTSSKKKDLTDCSVKPESIDQSIWRQGLPDPKGTPQETQVKHVILHHAAGSNTETDYTKVVRNYYLLHTESNGWDDIGYNFLVAQDGTIYDGRDGRGVCEDDNVLGAHMCARNVTTMGICLLGNYDVANVFPTDTSLLSVEKLVTWKLHKESLNAFDSSLHPTAGMLGTIAGHRDGCNAGYTECPGENYYQEIYARVKPDVDSMLRNCMPLGMNQEVSAIQVTIYPNPASNYFDLELGNTADRLEIFDVSGKVVLQKALTTEPIQRISTSGLNAGIYWVKVYDKQSFKTIRLFIAEK
jgi:hypothetical protein